MTRWEYLAVSFREKWLTLEQILDRRGPEGWELVAVDWDGRKAMFKRPGGEIQ